MNLVLLIGNGFDLKMGLHTSYQDFYNWYKDQPLSSKRVVNEFRRAIGEDNTELWSDLEKALGIYLEHVLDRDVIFPFPAAPGSDL